MRSYQMMRNDPYMTNMGKQGLKIKMGRRGLKVKEWAWEIMENFNLSMHIMVSDNWSSNGHE
ncbi:hypothetical protein A2U01_0063071, partial [Trifolium medium]|nr:hypothetical protein [Trifolium medium]